MDDETRKALKLLTDEAVTSAIFRASLTRRAGEALVVAADQFGIDRHGLTSSDLQEAAERRLAALQELQQQLSSDPA